MKEKLWTCFESWN